MLGTQQTDFMHQPNLFEDVSVESSQEVLPFKTKPKEENRSSEDTQCLLRQIDNRLYVIEEALTELIHLAANKQTIKEHYSTLEIARLLGKRPYSVREWCRLGRINATKTHTGRGIDKEWRVSHEELVRIQNEGLLPIKAMRLSVGRVNRRTA